MSVAYLRLCSHRLTGWNAVKSRVEQLGLQMTDDQVKDATAKIKELADVRTQSMEDVDTVLRVYHSGVVSGELELGDRQMFNHLLQRHRELSSAPVPEGSLSSTQPTPVAV
jgi:homocitrate synthase